jgi:glycosyltransferase involved in cell wall biosynthesis
MRILVLAPQPFFVHRGTPIAVRALVETLAAHGHQIDVIVFAEGENLTIPGCTFIRVPDIPGTLNVPPGFSVKKAVCDAVMLPMAAWRLARHRYDVIHAVEEAAFIAMLLSPLFGVPYVYDIDSSIAEQISDKHVLPGWLQRALVAAERRAVRRCIAAVVCCKALEELIRSYSATVPVLTLEDTAMVDPDTGEGPPDDCRFNEPVVMYVGNLEPYQGVGLLVDGFAEAARNGAAARLVVIGGIPTHIAAYRERAAGLGVGDRVSFLGPRPVDMLGRYLRQAAVVVSPRTQGRNTPMKVYSYLDCGRPLLATRLPTHTQVLDDDIAMLVHPTPADMARGLQRLLEDPALRRRLSDAASERVRTEFSREAFTRKLLRFYGGPIAESLKGSKSAESAA